MIEHVEDIDPELQKLLAKRRLSFAGRFEIRLASTLLGLSTKNSLPRRRSIVKLHGVLSFSNNFIP
jgi:hypothetical protein